jgi:hypothetical protein
VIVRQDVAIRADQHTGPDSTWAKRRVPVLKLWRTRRAAALRPIVILPLPVKEVPERIDHHRRCMSPAFGTDCDNCWSYGLGNGRKACSEIERLVYSLLIGGEIDWHLLSIPS